MTGVDHRPPGLPRHVAEFVDALAARSDVVAVRLGGSRGAGRVEALAGGGDWDLLAYVRAPVWSTLPAALPPGTSLSRFDERLPLALGEASSGHPDGVVDCAIVDLDQVDHSVSDSLLGSFRLVPMTRSLEGIPSYVLEAEAALSQSLTGGPVAASTPPPGLVEAAVPWWVGRAALSTLIAMDALRVGDRLTAQAHCVSALWSLGHSRAISTGWYLPDKRFLVDRADAYSMDLVRQMVTLPFDAARARVEDFADRNGLDSQTGLSWARVAAEFGPGRRG